MTAESRPSPLDPRHFSPLLLMPSTRRVLSTDLACTDYEALGAFSHRALSYSLKSPVEILLLNQN